ncbi:dihydrodipicolinate reductase [Streptomyces lunaelactis]|uniref:NAD(P)H-dependent amine dehydrogenase family protein n=1 Tax=Streptomyces lunaelactis TaxID=1535768 RepID=UPI001584E88C|nr:dihydrodipicolinate reductase [Streptomyces lunaelactis]NUK21592.1 dihydrodipicolinate reductase [Streptomyces lunaelactis]NUK51013.1 dihydrodipicolinate reductase [Streptomyces lunaelactis]NUK62747.1 dihydrodipicolinate reductase [Streptomyces lunaelactis]NUK77981.1 dihydrodipicolinate reductase [Streptomyces lunaelactis]NUL08338.1 dihydrodipicolinate reductase [Streptomyces lunaelactis]
MISTVVWGTGNVGRAAIRAVEAHPALNLASVLVHNPDKVGRDAGDLGGLDCELGVAATDDIDAVLAAGPHAVVYAASGDIRPDEALDDIVRAVRAGAVVVTPALYPLYDQRNAPPEFRDPVLAAIGDGSGSLFVSGVDPGWGNDVLPLLISGLGSTVDAIRCQEIFDYSTYEQEHSVRYLVGMGQPMDYEPMMLLPSIPTMVWGGQIRLMARALGVELDEIRETLERRPLDATVTTRTMGEFEAGTQGAVRFEVQGIVEGEPRIVIEHVTRIHASCAPDWPTPPGGGDGAHRVIIEGRPRIEVSVEATDEGENRSAGGNATAVGRLVSAIDWLVDAEPGLYDALDVPLRPAVGKLGRKQP